MVFCRKTWIWFIILASMAVMLYAIRGILLPFFAGFIIAYALTPVVDKVASMGIGRSTTTLLMIFISFLLIVGFFVIAIPFVISELSRLAHNIPSYGEQLFTTFVPLIDHFAQSFNITDVQEIKNSFSEYLGNMISWGLRFLASVLTNTLALANLVSLIILTPIVAFYLLRDWPQIMSIIFELLPKQHTHSARELFIRINKNMGAYIRGQIIVCAVLSLYFSIALSLAGLNYAVTIGLISGVLSFMPFVGLFISVVVSLGVAFAQQPEWIYLAIIASIFASGSVLENFIAPPLIGHSIGLHPVWIIFALLSLGSLFGFTGMLLSMPIAAALSVVVRFFIARYKESPLYLDQDHLEKNL